jgi:hypothetical protein
VAILGGWPVPIIDDGCYSLAVAAPRRRRVKLELKLIDERRRGHGDRLILILIWLLVIHEGGKE